MGDAPFAPHTPIFPLRKLNSVLAFGRSRRLTPAPSDWCGFAKVDSCRRSVVVGRGAWPCLAVARVTSDCDEVEERPFGVWPGNKFSYGS